jgi:uncharacterized protein (TIGR03643 family)
MIWEDRTPFEAIQYQFQLPEKEVIKLIGSNLKKSSFKRWCKHVNSGVSQKHLKKCNPEIDRFICTRQKAILLFLEFLCPYTQRYQRKIKIKLH